METLEDYKVHKLIKRGSFGAAYLATSKSTAEEVAIKEVIFKDSIEKEKQAALNEARLLASTAHPNIIAFKSAFYDHESERLFTVMEYAAKGDLASKIEHLQNTKKHLSEKHIWRFLLEMSQALKYLHQNNIIHRDLKPANIFITEDGTYKLADFNVSKLIKSGNGLTDTISGTPLYCGPEIWDYKGYDSAVDMWSLGVTAYELATLSVPYLASDIGELRRKIDRGRVRRINRHYSDSLNTVILSMIRRNPRSRPSANDLVERIVMAKVKASDKTDKKQKCQLLQTIHEPDDLYKLSPVDFSVSEAGDDQQILIEVPQIKHLSNASNKENTANPSIQCRSRVRTSFEKPTTSEPLQSHKSDRKVLPHGSLYHRQNSKSFVYPNTERLGKVLLVKPIRLRLPPLRNHA